MVKIRHNANFLYVTRILSRNSPIKYRLDPSLFSLFLTTNPCFLQDSSSWIQREILLWMVEIFWFPFWVLGLELWHGKMGPYLPKLVAFLIPKMESTQILHLENGIACPARLTKFCKFSNVEWSLFLETNHVKCRLFSVACQIFWLKIFPFHKVYFSLTWTWI